MRLTISILHPAETAIARSQLPERVRPRPREYGPGSLRTPNSPAAKRFIACIHVGKGPRLTPDHSSS